MRKPLSRNLGRFLLLLLAAALLWPFFAQRTKPLPAGLRVRKASRTTGQAQPALLVDTTAYDPASRKRIVRQEIFDAVLHRIDQAATFVYLDFFLWNDWQGITPETHRALAAELAEALLRKKAADPDITILVHTDPINRVYGRSEPDFYARLAAAGIPVVFTDLAQLRDPNPLYSIPARAYAGLLKRAAALHRWLDAKQAEHPLDPSAPPVTRRQIGRMLHFKANHRKLLIADDASGAHYLLVTSLNPADASSAHGNFAVQVTGTAAYDALESELRTVEWSGVHPGRTLSQPAHHWRECVARLRRLVPPPVANPTANREQPLIEWNTEAAIRNRLLAMLNTASPDDRISIAVFYLSDRGVVRAIRNAAAAGAQVRLILDPNKDAFGRIKNGIPNRPVAAVLTAFAARRGLDLKVRWADTHGEQFHGKAVSVSNPRTHRYELLCGSANFTRRNLRDFNMEASLYIADCPEIVRSFENVFDTAWTNSDELRHTVPYAAYAIAGFESFWKTWLYRIQEATGMCTY